jgi:sugar lactone lactonase YvrE
VNKKSILSFCGFVLLTLAAALPRTVLAQTNYYWQTIATPVSTSGGPQGVAVDRAGNIYVADTADDTILKATPVGTSWITSTNWVVTTIAGLAGHSGTNDGFGGAARFNSPNSLALGDPNTLIVADTQNNTIRKVHFTGVNWVVTTIAGKAQTSGSANGTNSVARFFSPTGVAANTLGTPQIVYVADENNALIRKIASIDGTNWTTTTIAGSLATAGTSTDGTNGVAGFNYPYDVTQNGAGNLFVADAANEIIRKLTPSGSDWIVTTIAGQTGSYGGADGTNLDAQFNFPSAVKADNAGNVYVSDTFNDTIRKLTPDGTNWIVTTIGGSAGSYGLADGTNDVAAFGTPQGVAVDSDGNVYVGDTGNNALRLGFLFPPSLHVAVAAHQTTLSYPTALGTNFSFTLQSTTNLANDWSDVTNEWQLDSNGAPCITLTNKAPGNFFRLELPESP